MSILDSVKAAFGSAGGDKNALWLYVRCARCGTPLAVRVDLRNEPIVDYENGGYVLYKEMMDSKCFTLMRAQVRFDDQHKVIEQSIDKGEFITREQYAESTTEVNK
ncbi:MAG: hypothetical protein M1482_10885 [Chloroflexi bacterium]|nr:hypothetical protein [Chloroflexota bacterium]